MDATESADSDGDGVGNNADSDDDSTTAFPMSKTRSLWMLPSQQIRMGMVGTTQDTDDDNDGIADQQDAQQIRDNKKSRYRYIPRKKDPAN